MLLLPATHCLPRSIVSYILLRHLPAGTRVTGHAGALDAALQRKHSSLDADVRAARLCEAAAERLRCALGHLQAAGWLRCSFSCSGLCCAASISSSLPAEPLI